MAEIKRNSILNCEKSGRLTAEIERTEMETETETGTERAKGGPPTWAQAVEMIVKDELVGDAAGVGGWVQPAPLAARWFAELLSRSALDQSISALDSQRISTEAQLGRACVCGTAHVRPLALATFGLQQLALVAKPCRLRRRVGAMETAAERARWEATDLRC